MTFVLALLPLLAAALVGALPERSRNLAAGVAGATALACCAILALMAPAVFAGEVLRASVPWFDGVNFGFRVDGLAFMFAGIVCAIGALVVLYARYYLSPDDPPTRFFAYLLAFMGAMLGVVLADNLILLVVFWELTSITSFLLIGFWRHRADARQGARMALAVTGAGGLCLLGGVLLLGHIAGGYELDRSAGRRSDDPRTSLVPAGAGAGAARRVHQIGAVPVPLLAAARDGGADAGVGVPALGDDGEGGGVPAGAAVSGPRAAASHGSGSCRRWGSRR